MSDLLRSRATGAVRRERLLLSAFATVVLVAPWDPERQRGAGEVILSAGILAGLWWYCRDVANSLSMEDAWALPDERRIFGEDAETLARWRKERARAMGHSTPLHERPSRLPSADPSRRVIRLIMIAIVAFALGEPFLLKGPPAAGAHALVAVAAFLLCASFVLAAASTIHSVRSVTHSKGRYHYDVLWQRLGAATAVSIVLLLGALSLPGITYRGINVLRPTGTVGRVVDTQRTDDNREELEEDQEWAGEEHRPLPQLPGSGGVGLLGGLLRLSQLDSDYSRCFVCLRVASSDVGRSQEHRHRRIPSAAWEVCGGRIRPLWCGSAIVVS